MAQAMLKEYGTDWAAGLILKTTASSDNLESWLADHAKSQWRVASIGTTLMHGNSSFKILFADAKDKETFVAAFPG